MSRLLLRFLNPPALVLAVIFGIALQTSLFSYYPFLYLQPDIVLLLVVWCALRRNFIEGGILTIIMVSLAEAHSSAPQGLFLSSYMAIYLTLRALARYLMLDRLSTLVIVTLFVSIAWKLLNLLILYLLGLSENQWRHTISLMAPGAIVEGICAIWVYRWLERFDWFTAKDPRARQELSEDLQLEEEM